MISGKALFLVMLYGILIKAFKKQPKLLVRMEWSGPFALLPLRHAPTAISIQKALLQPLKLLPPLVALLIGIVALLVWNNLTMAT